MSGAAAASAAPSAKKESKWDIGKVLAYLPDLFIDIIREAKNPKNESSQTTRLVQFDPATRKSNIVPASVEHVTAATLKPNPHSRGLHDERARVKMHFKRPYGDGVIIINDEDWAKSFDEELRLDAGWTERMLLIEEMIAKLDSSAILFENLHPTNAEKQGRTRLSSDSESKMITDKLSAKVDAETELCRSAYVAAATLPKSGFQFDKLPKAEKDQFERAVRSMVRAEEEHKSALAGRKLNSNCRSVMKGGDLMAHLNEGSKKYNYHEIALDMNRFYRYARELTSLTPDSSALKDLNVVAFINTVPQPTASNAGESAKRKHSGDAEPVPRSEKIEDDPVATPESPEGIQDAHLDINLMDASGATAMKALGREGSVIVLENAHRVRTAVFGEWVVWVRGHSSLSMEVLTCICA